MGVKRNGQRVSRLGLVERDDSRQVLEGIVRAGQKLKAIRKDRHMTVRQVEQASRRIAEAKGDKKFSISNGWLTQIENGASEPSICKLFSLSAIYNVGITELMRIYKLAADASVTYTPTP